jgi:hypothetical protein
MNLVLVRLPNPIGANRGALTRSALPDVVIRRLSAPCPRTSYGPVLAAHGVENDTQVTTSEGCDLVSWSGCGDLNSGPPRPEGGPTTRRRERSALSSAMVEKPPGIAQVTHNIWH